MKIIGHNIKKLREEYGFTLRELAERLNVSASFISQVEQGKTAPSLSTLKEIATELTTTVSQLMGEDADPEKHIFLSKQQRRVIREIGQGIKLEILTEPDLNKQMEALLVILARGATSGKKMYKHYGQEFVLVQKGALEVTLNEKKYLIKEGDTLYFKSSVPHSFCNKSNGRTEVVWIITPPSF